MATIRLYTEAFQYLCYCVGINANQVLGRAHVWNSVKIEGEWYQVDVTWDDPVLSNGGSGDGNHDNFNLTSEQMYEVHPPLEETVLVVPECTATDNAYKGDK